MRVTDRLIFERANFTTARARAEMDEAGRQAAGSSKIEHPGQDPAGAAAIVAGRAQLDRFASIARTSSRAFDELGQADAALGEVGAILARAQQLAIQGANAATSPTGRASSAVEIEAMILGVASALNLRVGNRYIFGGDQDHAPPFAMDGSYLGDTGVRNLEVAPGVLLDTSLRTEEVIKGAGGGVDVFALLRTLADALAADDVPGIQGVLDGLVVAIDQVASGRTQAGGLMNVLQSATDAAKAGEDAAKLEISRHADPDPVEAATRLALAQHALDAALTIASQSFRLTLLDKLR